MAAEIERQVRQRDVAGRRLDEGVERVADHLGLLVDLLQHEVAVFALADHGAGDGRQLDRALHLLARRVADHDGAFVEDHPVAVFQIGQTVGQRRQREGVGRQIHLAITVAITDSQRRAAPGTDHQVVLAGEDQRQTEGAFQALQGFRRRLDRTHSPIQVIGHQMDDDLGVGFGLEEVIVALQFGLQVLIVLDDAVMDDGNLARGMGMGVVLGRAAMGGPAGVADADGAGQTAAPEPGGPG